MEKLTYFFIDDVIWTFRDIAREKPASLFENGFMKMLRENHDKYGLTVQLNLFYATDVYYGNDFFNLSEMPDIYKDEFQSNKDWLRLAFHARQEFPDYPYVNATYEDVYTDYNLIKNEVLRFAGEGMFSDVLCTHWLPLSKEAVRALCDCGIRIVTPTVGDRREYEGDMSVLPYGHAARLLHNRQPETMLYTRTRNDPRILSSICAYNHISAKQKAQGDNKNISFKDENFNIFYREVCCGICLNLLTVEQIKERITTLAEKNVEYIGTATHEQYYYPDYFAYQSDTKEKFEVMCKELYNSGYRFVTADELK